MLLGPFVDVDNPAVGSGALDVTFEELFAMQVLHRFSAGLCAPRLRMAGPRQLGSPVKGLTNAAASALHHQDRIGHRCCSGYRGQSSGRRAPARGCC